MRYLYVANWKMNMSFNESIKFCKKNGDTLQQLCDESDIALCPSFVALASVAEILKNSTIAIGAQNCSEHLSGPYTGEESVLSLAQIDISYCIVGHSERRIYYGETTELIIKKINILCENNITPIICIGEKQEDFVNEKTFAVLIQQLEPIIAALQQQKNKRVIIAYEPVWAIGTDIIPDNKTLERIFSWLAQLFNSQLSHCHVELLYGGSVNSANVAQLKTIPNINGFLIGNASTDIDEFLKIIKMPQILLH